MVIGKSRLQAISYGGKARRLGFFRKFGGEVYGVGVFTNVVKNRFATLLAESWCSEIGDLGGEGGGAGII